LLQRERVYFRAGRAGNKEKCDCDSGRGHKPMLAFP
jgi:hypothetical protein